jgi:alpha-N-arabinofuranosidase
MFDCSVALDPTAVVAPVPARLFGSFVEHMGRCVYGGVFEPGSPYADENGSRTDVLELTRELGVTVARYPGGNFLSTYRWEDGVGPVDERPRRLDLAWRSVEPNTFGLSEFVRWARSAGVEPMLGVNLATRGVAAACDLLEYANFPGGTQLSDRRIAHGDRDPYGVKLWCLGNELDGPWQIGQQPAAEYGRLAAETAKAMRRLDPGIELVACGSSNEAMPTFGTWEKEVLEQAFDYVDYISLHAYFDPEGGRRQYLASARTMDAMIEEIAAVCDRVAARKRSRRVLKLCFDEWNVWRQRRFLGADTLQWGQAPRLIEDQYTAEDAVVVGSLLMSLLRHSDRLAAACQAQLVNVIAPIRAESDAPAWRQTIFHPFALTARHAHGNVLYVDHSRRRERIGKANVDLAVTHDPASDRLAIFAMNRHIGEAARLSVRLPGDRWSVGDHFALGGENLRSTNAKTHPDRVVPRRSSDHTLDGSGLTISLPPVSWTVCTLVQGAQEALVR